MALIKRFLFILLLVFLVAGCNIIPSDDKPSDDGTKSYKMNSSEYFDYIKSTLLDAGKKSNYFEIKDYRKRSVPYLVAKYYTSKCLSKKVAGEEVNKILKYLYDKFSNNNYKSGGLLASDFEYLNLSFYNCDSPKNNQYSEIKYIQIDFTKINKYSNFNEFLLK